MRELRYGDQMQDYTCNTEYQIISLSSKDKLRLSSFNEIKNI